ncbi:heterogeneous nuclear ribonucleoprotein Q-like [Tasmannia lanceolata]|uniref:heterogeneous nuclear ribonucleoprotein Q-like n=1 Tax=Tasmannia lanceolata TaxID=3420 RepID=UPI004062A46B
MAENASVGPEEQVDLDDDNEIEEMLDEDIEEALGDDLKEIENEVQDRHVEEERGSVGEGHEKTLVFDGADDADSSMSDEEKLPVSKDEEDSEKRAELLALPPYGSEIFIGGLPRDATEDDLRGLCELIGDIAEIRLVKDKDTGVHKGYAFVTFKTKESAQQAIEDVHNKEFKGKTLRCSLSQVKHRLFIGNIPKTWAEEDLRRVIEENGPGVENIELLKDALNPSRNRGFAFVEYYNHACADYARQKMSSGKFKLEGNTPTVTWADPKNSPDPSAAAQVKALYVKNLPDNTTPEQLKELFQCHGEVTKVVLPPGKPGQNKRDFGFIHFAERSSALKAVKGTEKYEIDGQVLDVSLAKPQSDRKLDAASYRGGLVPSYVPHSSYGFVDPYGAYGAGYGTAGFGQPMIYGRGPMPSGMQMVPMVLPDGRLGYVLQQPGAQASSPPARRNDRSSGSSGRQGRGGGEGNRGRRYRPY